MTDYERGFLEGLQAAVIIGQALWDSHFANSENKEKFDEEYRDAALDSAMAVGCFVSDLKCLAASVHRKQIDPSLIAKSEENQPNYWWATPDGQGES